MSEILLPIATMVFGILMVAGMFVFGLRIYDRRQDHCTRGLFGVLRHWLEVTKQEPPIELILEAWDDVLRRRNKFWELFGQVALSVVVSVIVAVLLLTKTIGADAGLPILSAIVAFVVGKGISGQGRGSTRAPTPPSQG